MRVLTQEQQKLILEFIDGNIFADELTAALGPIPFDTPSLLIALLESSIASGNAEEAESALGIANGFKNDRAFGKKALPLLLTLLKMGGHYHHETIVNILQRIKSPQAINILHDTALGVEDYLKYDEFFRIARKCIWALADTGNEEAYQKLKLLAANSNVRVATYAQQRLESWEKEQARKAFHFLP